MAQLFSDPPLNVIDVAKSGTAIVYAGGDRAPANGLYAGVSDGAYRVAFRAHQLAIANGASGRHVFSSTVALTEITGSESFVHLKRDSTNWVAVLQGVHEFPPGRALQVELDPDDLFIFDLDGRLVAGPPER